ncbi:hypothetical protein Tco_0300303 [Tanacetum coccineum]
MPLGHVFPAEEQPLPAVVSPTADSPGYIPESDPEEEDEEDPEEDPAYYPADIGDDDEEDEEESTSFCLGHCFLLPLFTRIGETSAAGAARHDVPAIPREDPYVVAREDLYKFVDMVDDAPRHPGCPISRELDYGITDEWDGLVEAIEEIAHPPLEVSIGMITDLSTTFGSGGLPSCMVESVALISGLQAADHQRQVQLTMALKLLKGLQTQMAEFQMGIAGTQKVRQNPILQQRRSSVVVLDFWVIVLAMLCS